MQTANNLYALAIERQTDDRASTTYGLAPGTYIVSGGRKQCRRRPGGGAAVVVVVAAVGLAVEEADLRWVWWWTGGGGATAGGYDHDAPIFAPSSARDTAVEVNVSAGEEVNT